MEHDAGQQKVSIVHVDDAAKAYVFALTSGAVGNVFNIAGKLSPSHPQALMK